MVDLNIMRQLGVTEDEINKSLVEALGPDALDGNMDVVVSETIKNFSPGSVLAGTVVGRAGDDVVVEVGLKSEGLVSIAEFDDPSEVVSGEKVEVILEAVESDTGQVVLSKRKADRLRGWEKLVNNSKEDDVVTGKVMRKIKGGLLVDVGVPVFLPASQVDIRRPSDIGAFIGRPITAKILKIDQERRNIVISRRRYLEDERSVAKDKLLKEIEVGQIRKGVVKNIADFGAFVDLGGIDGLLHITDMSWGRIGHPSDMVSIDEEVEVMVLSVDLEREKIGLGLKQKSDSPWSQVLTKYPPDTRVRGTVVNIMNYGVFVKLEEGLEGLVHISEMSWTRRLNHPSELVGLGDEVEVIVLGTNKEKQEISLGMKQAQVNPWTLIGQKHPPGSVIDGRVRNLTNYGAFIEIEEGIDGLLHVSDMSWTRRITHPSELLKKGESVKCMVLNVDEEKMRVALGLKQLTEDPWDRAIPEKYVPGQIVKGTVAKITAFGVFVQLEPELEGLLHISELADHKVDNPEDMVKMGQELEVKILRVDLEDRKIGLSLKRVRWAEEESEDGESSSTAPAKQLRGGLHGTVDLGSDFISYSVLNGSQPSQTESPTPAEETEEREQPEPSADEQPTAEAGTSEQAGDSTDTSTEPEATADPEPSPPAESVQPAQSEDETDIDNKE
ncbi:MAG: 30S ribosomal protein S1 [Actinobacteria bacterium]|nr:30S ribosomal protein S1 [Actinomycetota bacterium]